MLCALATLVTVPVVLISGASSDGGSEVAIVVPETISASELEADVDVDDLFDAGANLDDVPEPVGERGTTASAEVASVEPDASGQVAAIPQALVDVDEPGSGSIAATPEAASTELVTSTTISSAPATAAPAPSTTAPSTTAAPTTQSPSTTAPPATAAPTTATPTTTEVAPVVEEPQSAEPAPEVDPSQPTPEQWAALRHCESSGNYSVVSSNGRYHGAYQFYQPTWDGLANQVGRSDLVGLPPSQAAPGDQDALALLLWQQRGNQPWPHCGRHLPAGP